MTFRRILAPIMASPGAYLLKRNGRNAYVGRSDRDVISHMRKVRRFGFRSVACWLNSWASNYAE